MNINRQPSKTGKITALYERLSKDDELHGPSNSIINQRSYLEDFAQKSHLTNVVNFQDDGWSGTRWDRPGFLKLMDEVSAGNVAVLLVKDLTRLGRDHIRVGLCLEALQEHNVRLIAINDGVDTAQGDDVFIPFRNIISEMYARDISIKIKSVIKSNGEKGKRLTNAPIYGYRLDPDDKTKWILDDEASEIVRRIFRMTIEGMGPQMIAKALSIDKVERPSYYLTKRGIVDLSHHGGEDVMYNWNTKTVSDMIAKPEYMGHTVNFRTNKPSYKAKLRTKLSQEEWKVFENTHTAIVDTETWELAQKCRETKRRPTPNLFDEPNPLTGLMFCADCGRKMYNHRERKSEKLYYHKTVGKFYPRSARDVYYCSAYHNETISPEKACTQHFIRTTVVRELVLDTIKNTSSFVRNNEAAFVEQVREASEIQQEAEAKKKRKQLSKDKKRYTELDVVISKLFEQNATGKVTDSRFETLLVGYENEQLELDQSIEKLQCELESFNLDGARADRFVEIAKKFTDFSELTTPMINEFVEKIVVHEADKSSGERFQRVDIYLNFIGKFEAPIEATEPAPEEIVEAEKLQKRRKKKREAFQRYVDKRQKEMAQENLE